MTRISVVVPTYKRPKLLLTCLQHLQLQSLDKEEFEVLVVSDGYDAETEVAVVQFAQMSGVSARYLHTDGKQGPATARNIGWRSAASPLVAFTDDDCQPTAHWLAAFLKQFEKGEYAVFTGFTKVPLRPKPSDFALNTAHLQTAEFITANCACSKEALQSVGGFDERFKAAWREDSDLQFKFLDKNIPIFKVHEAVVIHPVREDAKWYVSIKEQKKGVYDALLYKKYPKRYRTAIQPKSMWNYYLAVVAAILFLVSLLARWPAYLRLSFLAIFLLLIILLFFKRIKPLRKTPKNVASMLLTSIAIPFASVYWRLYGSFKFRVFFL